MSVFDRLSKQGTASSYQRFDDSRRDRDRRREEQASSRRPPATRFSKSNTTTRKSSNNSATKQESSVYNRLYQSQTASSAARGCRSDGDDKIMTRSMREATTSRSTRNKNKEKTRHVKKSDVGKANKPDETKAVVSAVQPPSPTNVPIRMNLHIRTKYEKKENDAAPYSKLSLLQPEARKTIKDYESGNASGSAVAVSLITSLFYRDFMPGKHWDIDAATVCEQVDETTVEAFTAKKQATWDWKDIYSIATAKATIRISRLSEDVYIDDYSYCVAG